MTRRPSDSHFPSMDLSHSDLLSADEDDLGRRALAAAAEARAQEQARLKQMQEAAARRHAEMVWRLKTEAAKRLEETLGYPSKPNDWEYGTHSYKTYDEDVHSYNYVETKLLGIDIFVVVTGRKTADGWEEYLDWKLTMADFGKMLEQKRQQEQR